MIKWESSFIGLTSVQLLIRPESMSCACTLLHEQLRLYSAVYRQTFLKAGSKSGMVMHMQTPKTLPKIRIPYVGTECLAVGKFGKFGELSMICQNHPNVTYSAYVTLMAVSIHLPNFFTNQF